MLVKLAGTTLDFAKQELDAIGMTSNNKEEMNREMRKNIIDVLKTFSKQGHSGFSASYAISLLEKLLRHKPLSPLTGKDDEWNDVSETSALKGKHKLYQNKRLSSVFKDETGKAWDIDGIEFKDKTGCIFTSKDSKIPVTFPYTQKIKTLRRD